MGVCKAADDDHKQSRHERSLCTKIAVMLDWLRAEDDNFGSFTALDPSSR